MECRNEVSAREGIDTQCNHQPPLATLCRRNEVSAREGIDTLRSRKKTAGGWSVEMRYQPERALTLTVQLLQEITKLSCRNEVSAREGIDTEV